MRQTLIIVILFFILSTYASGQIFIKKSGETAEQLIERIRPDSLSVAHQIIETTAWTKEKTIIAFLGHDTPDLNIGFNKITGYLLYPVGDNKYKRIILESIEEDGGLPEVIALFFANIDSDSERELGVLCKFWQHSYEHMGDLYETFFFDNPNESDQLIEYNREISGKFSGCDCDYRESKSTKAKFKTVEDIKNELQRLGY